MARRGKPDPAELLGSLEARIMEDVWEHGESSVGEVLERLNNSSRRSLAYNTVMSVMARLAEKGILVRERHGRAFRYQAKLSKTRFVRDQAAQAAREFMDDFGDAALAGFVDAADDDPKLRQKLEKLLKDKSE